MSHATPLPKFEITSEQIETVVRIFYANVRKDPVLGPIFASRITHWSPHEQKISSFWHNAIGLDRSYQGSPQAAHMSAHAIKGEHFAIWLSLFDTTLHQELPQDTAKQWSALAHRIGRALKMSIDHRDAPANAPPKLF